jgi:hypothetical protein
MKRVFVCSPLRGADGQPSEANVKLARKLMRAVFDAGHAPFVPHLLYPQVLTESEKDLTVAFAANLRFLNSCDEVWIYARTHAECSRGMLIEVTDVERGYLPGLPQFPRLVWMPPEFERVKVDFEHELLTTTQTFGICTHCGKYNGLNSQRLCILCFSQGTPAPAPGAAT